MDQCLPWLSEEDDTDPDARGSYWFTTFGLPDEPGRIPSGMAGFSKNMGYAPGTDEHSA